MIYAADLNTRLNIEQRTSSQDELGQPVESWSLVAAVWGSVRHLSGVAAIKSGADGSTVKASFRIRYMAGIDSGMRVTVDGKHYNIVAILPNKAERYIDLVAEVVE